MDMKTGIKHIEVEPEVHKTAKAYAKKAGISLKKYIQLCVAQCKSDVKER